MTEKTSKRARMFWQRMCDWYGARIAEQYGPTPPADWCGAVDDATNEAMQRALAEVKIKHPVHPPTFPQFDALISRHAHVIGTGPSLQERLGNYVLKHRTLTFTQVRMPWTYRFLGEQCIAVDIPDDGETKGFRVRVADMPAETPAEWARQA
jgi:hypothetical protein